MDSGEAFTEGNLNLRIAYLNFGAQSGVTKSFTRGLTALGHSVLDVDAMGSLEWRDRKTRELRPSAGAVLGLAASALEFGRHALGRRWNTSYAFDAHSRSAGAKLAEISADVVLQNGALFAPGAPPRLPYVQVLDNTCRLAARQKTYPEAGFGKPSRIGAAWLRREAEVYRNARAVCSFSRVVRDSLIDDYGVLPQRAHVIGAGANMFPADPARRHDGNTLLFVGKDFARKGGFVLLRAFEQLRKRRPAARLLIVGPPTQPAPMPEGASFLGSRSFSEVQELFAQATALVLPTLREPFGIAYLDALACGVACIGTRVGAVPETLEEGLYGLLVPPADPVALAEAMRTLLDDPARAEAMGAAGRRKVAERCRWEHVIQRLVPFLEGEAR